VNVSFKRPGYQCETEIALSDAAGFASASGLAILAISALDKNPESVILGTIFFDSSTRMYLVVRERERERNDAQNFIGTVQSVNCDGTPWTLTSDVVFDGMTGWSSGQE